MTSKIIMSIILFLLLGQLGLLGFCYFEYYIRSSGEFFGKLPDGKVFKLTWLDRPNVSTKALLSWATLAATASYTMDFVNYNDNLAKLRDYFTKEGYDNFITSLNDSGTLDSIRDKKLVVSAVAIGPAIVTGEDEVRGYHLWRVEVPIIVSYLSASAEEKRERLITLTISQVPTTDAPKGIGIAQFVTIDLNPDVMG